MVYSIRGQPLSQCLGVTITTHSGSLRPSTEDTVKKNSSDLLSPSTSRNQSQNSSDRQKRLLPYIRFHTILNETKVRTESRKGGQYHSNVPREIIYQPNIQNNDYYKNDNDYTPFQEANALPGSFSPIIRDQPKPVKVHFFSLQNTQAPQELGPDFGAIYDKLWELKSKQRLIIKDQNYDIPLEQLPPRQYSNQFLNRFKFNPTKTIIQTYSPTNIDIPAPVGEIRKPNYKDIHLLPPKTSPVRLDNNIEPFSTNHVILDLPQNTFSLNPKQREGQYRKPIVVFRRPPTNRQKENIAQNQKPVLLVQTRPLRPHKFNPSPIIEENYVAQKYVSVPKYQVQTPNPIESLSFTPEYYKYDYRVQPVTPAPIETSSENRFTPEYYKYESNFVAPVTASSYVSATENIEHNQLTDENANSLSLILKKLQDANAVPHTLTVENIDNSIKTLVKILNSLKKPNRLSKPIIVAAEGEEYNSDENSSEEYSTESPHVNLSSEPVLPIPDVTETIDNTYPEDTQEGGTPGTAGVDYPALSSIPPTSFDCKTQRYKGFFGDPDTNCQVWHYCDLNGGQASFLCPNGTIFSQVALTCDWWYNVKCSSTAQLYVLNERLYKYILPFAPKFPEDYTGPLVDKYLALKFMEMEEKMKKERKGKEEDPEQTTVSVDESIEVTTIGNISQPT